MAKRTPGLQDRSTYPRDWGNWPTPADLPNATGAPLTDPQYQHLEAGDVAYVFGTDAGRYHCVAPGASGVGDAVWLNDSSLVPPLIGSARRDHSVNGALVEGYDTARPVLRTKTDGHVVGAYTGLGLGNKAIIGHFLPAPMLLSALVSVDITVERITPEATFLPPITNGYAINVLPYLNLVVDLGPVGIIGPGSGGIAILVFGDVNNVLLLGAYSVPGVNQHRCLWTAGDPGSGVLVVNGAGMFVSPSPAGALFVPASQNAPLIYLAASWQNFAFDVAAIVAAYPGAMIVNAYSADNGLPKSPTITSGVMAMIGSSSLTTQNAVRVLDWQLNGVSI